MKIKPRYLSTWKTLSQLVSSLVCSDDDSIDEDDDEVNSLSVELGAYRLIALLLSNPGGTCCGVSSGVLEQKESCETDELRLDKTNKMTARPAKTQISLGIRPVWSEPLLCTQWVTTDPNFLYADSEDSDWTGRMPRLIWVFAGNTCHFVGFVMLWLR